METLPLVAGQRTEVKYGGSLVVVVLSESGAVVILGGVTFAAGGVASAPRGAATEGVTSASGCVVADVESAPGGVASEGVGSTFVASVEVSADVASVSVTVPVESVVCSVQGFVGEVGGSGFAVESDEFPESATPSLLLAVSVVSVVFADSVALVVFLVSGVSFEGV